MTAMTAMSRDVGDLSWRFLWSQKTSDRWQYPVIYPVCISTRRLMADTTQNFANHVRYDPAFHFFLIPVMGVTIVSAIVHLVRHFSLGSFWWLVLAIAGLVTIGRTRFYALRVQDRVIRLEERLRLMSVLPDPLRSRVGELTDKQFIGLR